MAKAALLAVGAELLLPESHETNTLWLTRELFSLGIRVVSRSVVGDGVDEGIRSIRAALAEAEILLITGGLGPTEDDRVREALAAAFDRPLIRHPDLEHRVRILQKRLGNRVPDNALTQADLPEGAEPIPNSMGTAPGIWLEAQGQCVAAMPGVPREMKTMWKESVRDRLADGFPTQRPLFLLLRTAGLPESHVGERLPAQVPAGVERTILAHLGTVDVFHFAWAESAEEAQVRAAHEAARAALGRAVYSEIEEELETVVIRLLGERGETLATAESCTGGLVAHRLTDVPGASKALLAGWTVYSNRAKVRDLGIPEPIIDRYGAVSEPVARGLAESASDRGGSDWGIGITGIAGPGGGSEEKPVGTVHIAVSREGADTSHREFQFPGTRSEVKWRSSQAALDLLRRRLQDDR